MTVDKVEMRRLAEAANPGPWFVSNGFGEVRDDHGDYVCDTCEIHPVNSRFIAIANPAAILSLLDDNDQLRSEIAELKSQLSESRANDRTAMGYLADLRHIAGGYDFPSLVRNVAAMRVNSDRYSFIRRHVRAPIVVRNTIGHLYAEWMDEAVDAAITENGES